jgi:tetratricopeptide (TPR) repeat protein
MVYIYLGEYDKSIEDSSKIIDDLGLKYHWAYYNRAVAYVKKGFYNEALNDFYSAKKQTSNEEFIKKVDQHIEEIEAVIWGIQPGIREE